MAYQKVTRQSYGSRVANSFKGIIVGIILLILSTVLLFWNEGRAVKTQDTINEAREAAVEMPDISKADSSFEGKLVYATGLAETDDTLTDSLFGVSAAAVSMERKVEYYQWEETTESKTKKKTGGGTETVTTYHYKEKWVSEPVDSSKFENKAGHENTVLMQLDNQTFTAPNVSFGAYKIPDFMKTSIGKAEALPLDIPEETLDEVNRQVIAGASNAEAGRDYVSAKGSEVYIGLSPASPRVGDVRITFTQKKPAQISLLAVARGNTFEQFKASNGQSFYLIDNGTVSLEGMLRSAEESNAVMTWILRAVGTVLVMIGIGLIFAPLGTLADVVPLFGNIVGAGTGFISFLLGFAWSFVIIAVAWLRYRPLLGIGLLAGAILLIVMLFIRGRGRKKIRIQTAAPVQAVSAVGYAPAQASFSPPPSQAAQTQASSSPTPAQKYCPNCGAPQRQGARFCAGCGSPVN